MKRFLKIDFVRFCLVGAVGFMVHSSMYFVLRHPIGLLPEISYLTAAEIALFCSFTIHHFWTYRQHDVKKPKRLLLAQYHASFWSGALINFSVFEVVTRVFGQPDIYGLVAGSGTALLWNFFWTRYRVWRHSPHSEHTPVGQDGNK